MTALYDVASYPWLIVIEMHQSQAPALINPNPPICNFTATEAKASATPLPSSILRDKQIAEEVLPLLPLRLQ